MAERAATMPARSATNEVGAGGGQAQSAQPLMAEHTATMPARSATNDGGAGDDS